MNLRELARVVIMQAMLFALVGAMDAGCHPALPPVAGCVAGVYRCAPSGAPEVCSASSRWEPIGNAPCSRVGAVCVAPTDGPAHCARAQSDAAADAPDASDGGAE